LPGEIFAFHILEYGMDCAMYMMVSSRFELDEL
jgi:hypothetical protein